MTDLQRAEAEIHALRDRLAECESAIAGNVAPIPSKSFVERARVAIASRLAHGRPPIGAIARALHASPRTIQRRLGEQGTSYGDLIDSVRRERVESLVTAGRLSITEIAFLAGFTDVSGFRRAYKRWTGLAPSDARARENGSKHFT
jgi:AraC-like DNA-binding protein